VINPGDTNVILPKYAMLGTLTPVVCVGSVDYGERLTGQQISEPEKVRVVEEERLAAKADWPPRRKRTILLQELVKREQFLYRNWSNVSPGHQSKNNRGIMEPVYGFWASQIVLIIKRNGTTRFYVDSCRLNDVTRKDVYPLPSLSRIKDNQYSV
jgi:hypothetical protein